MKKIFLFSSRLRVYLTEIPPVFLLILAIKFNSAVDTLMKLYPLIITLSALIVFIAVYFFRAVVIGVDEVKCIGPFSSKEKAIIAKEKSLVITILPKRRLRIELFGNGDDLAESCAWLKNDTSEHINLFRSKANGGVGTARRILRYFDVSDKALESLIEKDGYSEDFENVTVTSDTVNEAKAITVYFKNTI